MKNENFTILITDDDEAVRHSLKMFLGVIYDDVKDFGSGAELLADIHRFLNCCLVLDMHMPEMSGLEVMEILAERSIQIPTILMTGRTDSHLRGMAMNHGVVALLDKPFEHELLLSAIEKGRLSLAS